MPKRMLIDASHPEETRVVVLDGQKVEEFDFEAASKRPLKGNIYLAKVTRVEPSLQAAFVEYGGNRQGFLAFSEIHPDYYQIPVADRLALLAEQEAEARRRDDDEFESFDTATRDSETAEASDSAAEEEDEEDQGDADSESSSQPEENNDERIRDVEALAQPEASDAGEVAPQRGGEMEESETADIAISAEPDRASDVETPAANAEENETPSESAQPQTQAAHRPSQRWVRRRHYKIQEVIKRRQVILVQVVKEERGNKGAALTTYLSLAGRYCVLMPNTPRGGGISRKITNANDRKRLKSAAQALELPEGMGLIIRTAGENRTKVEIKRDYEYLLRMWDTIREITLKSNAPACVYEEGDLIKRAIRDLYNKDVAEIIVEGEDGYRNAKDFMRMLMPSHAKNVKQYKETIPLFQRLHIEAQLDAMFSPTVTLRSGGYIVINQTEALVAIDVNSGRATREHSIEDTAYKTNLEAADEVARQLRLRDLAGLIVIDFIDMEDSRNDRNVEKKLRDCVKNDRARVQIGKISQFGLLEMSRQRLRAGVVAGSTIPCPACGGQGIVRSVESTALRVLRALDEEGQRQRANILLMHVPVDVAMYTLNQKRREIARMEHDYGITITFQPKTDMLPGTFELERVGQRAPEETVRLPAPADDLVLAAPAHEPEDVETVEEGANEEFEEEIQEAMVPAETGSGQEGGGRRRRRRRRRGRDRGPQQLGEAPAAPQHGEEAFAVRGEDEESDGDEERGEAEQAAETGAPRAEGEGGGGRRRRRRRRRGRRGPREGNGYGTQEFGATQESNAPGQAIPEGEPAYANELPTPELTRTPIEQPFAVEPNAPSAPVWSLFPENAPQPHATPVSPEPATEKPEPTLIQTPPPPARDEATPEAAAAEERAPHHPLETSSNEPPPPARKGWWQRPFRLRE